jgi:hypothetical protein
VPAVTAEPDAIELPDEIAEPAAAAAETTKPATEPA